MKKLINSIRYSLISRVILLFLLTAFSLVVVVRLSILAIVSTQFKDNVLPHVVEYQHYIEKEIGFPANVITAQQIAQRSGAIIHIRSADINWSSDGRPFDPSVLEFKQHDNNRLKYCDLNNIRYLLSEQNNQKIYVGFSRRLKQRGEGLVSLLVIIGIIYFCYKGIRWLFSPIGTIRIGVQKMGEGELDHRIQISRKDELGELASAVNTMAGDIEGMLDSKREMLLAISHELRSPLTRSRVSVELIEDDTIRENLSRDMKEMEQLITELLESERLNQRHAQLNRSAVLVNDLVFTVLEESFPNDDIRTHLAAENTEVQLDDARTRLLIKNLLANAVRHNRLEQGGVEISTVLRPDCVEICVVDHGAGIAPEHLPRITEPFYRPDPSRQRKTGGYGLGLYLCRMIAEAHDGSIKIDSQLGQGTQVRVILQLEKH
ncbi:MAG: HAMP domain-containing protein [Pseudomonadales bacterium]|nr:HAMP domain-containing protein [Pseudomonadales bacterium]